MATQKKQSVPAEKLLLEADILMATFGLKKADAGAEMTDWLAATGKLGEAENDLFEKVFAAAKNKMAGWNEEELKMKFISFLFFLAEMEEPGKIATFFERRLSGVVGGHSLSVVCNCLLAVPVGFTTPKLPYFFLQEFKRGKGDQKDPEGQMLAAMLIARELNADGKPVYGAWVNGRIWYFNLLVGDQIQTAPLLDAENKAHLLQIIFMLRKLKTLILNRDL